MLFNEFERLVNRATGGFMLESEVSDVVRQLKGEKAKIMRVISKMSAGDERRGAFAKLHALMYKLYDARFMLAKMPIKSEMQLLIWFSAMIVNRVCAEP